MPVKHSSPYLHLMIVVKHNLGPIGSHTILCIIKTTLVSWDDVICSGESWFSHIEKVVTSIVSVAINTKYYIWIRHSFFTAWLVYEMFANGRSFCSVVRLYSLSIGLLCHYLHITRISASVHSQAADALTLNNSTLNTNFCLEQLMGIKVWISAYLVCRQLFHCMIFAFIGKP